MRFRGAAAGGAVAVAVALSGLLLGWLWFLLAPRYEVEKVEGGYRYLDQQPTQPVGAEVTFALIGLVAGLVLAGLVWGLLWRWRGLPVLLGLSVGSVAAGYVAWRFGVWLSGGELRTVLEAAADGQRVTVPLRLRMTDDTFPTGVVALPGFGAALLYTAFAAFSPYSSLRPERPYGQEAGQLGPEGDGSSDNGTGTARS